MPLQEPSVTISLEAYRNQLLNAMQACGIPRPMWEQMSEYIAIGRPPGEFLRSVLENNLYRAAEKADDLNLPRLPDYVTFLHGIAPVGCYGSAAAYSGWTRSGGLVGRQNASTQAKDALEE